MPDIWHQHGKPTRIQRHQVRIALKLVNDSFPNITSLLHTKKQLVQFGEFIETLKPANSTKKNIYRGIINVVKNILWNNKSRTNGDEVQEAVEFILEWAQKEVQHFGRLYRKERSAANRKEKMFADGTLMTTKEWKSLTSAMKLTLERLDSGPCKTMDEAFLYQICLVELMAMVLAPQRTSFYCSLELSKNLSCHRNGDVLEWRYQQTLDQAGDAKNRDRRVDARRINFTTGINVHLTNFVGTFRPLITDGSHKFLLSSTTGAPMATETLNCHIKRIACNVLHRPITLQQQKHALGAKFYRALMSGEFMYIVIRVYISSSHLGVIGSH